MNNDFESIKDNTNVKSRYNKLNFNAACNRVMFNLISLQQF